MASQAPVTAEGLRATLMKYRDSGRISTKLYQEFYGQAKGGKFKSEKAMPGHLHEAVGEERKSRAQAAAVQAQKQRALEKRQRQLQSRQQRAAEGQSSGAVEAEAAEGRGSEEEPEEEHADHVAVSG
eukprot:CAMPEP_0175682342 /NCGR_PEP_ID=MMETSP0097-20121207/25765_1 /TAXON_ID=311494 /ORGANISM="Alexandrium monilatum, Strain CCMP3105" /LENGTH=126 /DNA_ID=CAMNT_0016989223 /DNA_START=48 /DNA_END=428 /DNA_ORIENTATION=+